MTNGTKDSATKKRHPFLTLSGLFGVFLVVLLITLLITVVVFPAPVLRYVFSRVEVRSGIAVTFDTVSLDFWSLTFDGLTAKRQNHHAGNFDLKAENVRVSLLPETVHIEGLRGTYERIGNKLPDEAGRTEDATASPKGYKLVALLLEDAEVDFIDRTLENLFQATIKVENFVALKLGTPSLFDPYACLGTGQIDSATFVIARPDDKPQIIFSEVPFGLLSPYAPVLNDIFDTGSMNVQIDDFSDKTQKRIRVNIWLQPDCRIKSADRIIAPAIRTALQTLDQSSLNELHDLKGQLDRLKTVSESWSAELEGVTRMIDSLGSLVPRDVRAKYDKYKSQFDRTRAIYTEWNNLTQELDRLKIGIVEDTFQKFIASGVPIEIDLLEKDGVWQYDTYDIVVRLVEKNYRTVVSTKYQNRIQEIRNAVDLLLKL